MMRTLTAVLHQEKNLFVAECPEVGTVSQGADIEEAIRNLREPTELCLEESPTQQFARPIVFTMEQTWKTNVSGR